MTGSHGPRFGIARSMTGPVPHSRRPGRSNPLPAWLALAGALLPFELSFYIADAKFTPGRLIIVLLLLPALAVVFRKDRHLLVSDMLMFMTAVWMIYAGYLASTLSSAGAEALELFGGYIVGRAYFFERPALENFVRVLKVVIIILVGLGLADTFSGRFIAHDIVSGALHVEGPFPQYRNGWVRATSTLDHPILYGVFCAFAAAIFLYSERRVTQRVVFVSLCAIGCIASLSSAAYLGLGLIVMVYAYDCLLKKFSWRWQVLVAAFGGFIALVFLLSNSPVGWLVSHMTLDPETGYYRVMIWDVATAQIALSPIFGFGIIEFNDQILDNTVDSVWLVMSLRFGIPMIALLFLTILMTFILKGQRYTNGDDYMDQLGTGFTLVLVAYLTVGLTVHFWNYTWIFWGLCAGIRGSLRERQMAYLARAAPGVALSDAGIGLARRSVAAGIGPLASRR